MAKSIFDLGKESLQQWRMLAEELEVQMALGKAEARDLFEREQKNLSKFINQQRAQFEKAERVKQEHHHDLLVKFENVEQALNSPAPGGKRNYDKYKKEVLSKIYELEYAVKEYYGEVSNEVQRQLDQFKAKLDGYRIQLALSEPDENTNITERKSELRDKVTEIRSLLRKEETDEMANSQFMEEISASVKHLRNAFSDLLGQ